jgi:hypothetical protein
MHIGGVDFVCRDSKPSVKLLICNVRVLFFHRVYTKVPRTMGKNQSKLNILLDYSDALKHYVQYESLAPSGQSSNRCCSS